MRILIADKLSDSTVQQLADPHTEIRFQPDLSEEQLPDAIGDANVLVVRSTKVTSATIDLAAHLSLIIRAGAGVNTIDVETASSRGIYVTNCPGKNSDAVAELAIGLLIACDRRIVDAGVAMRSGQWRKKEFGKAAGLRGRRLGILGLGTIGRAVVRRAIALEMSVTAWSRSLTPEIADGLGIKFAPTPLDVARTSDAVSLHLAATKDTVGLVDAEFLSQMKPGSILVNTSRGDIIDTAALKLAIAEKNLRVGLDVFADEPADGTADFLDSGLAQLVTATPHIGASTEQASQAIADEVVRIVRSFRETGRPANVVNLCARSPATHSLVVRHFNRVGVIAGVLDALREEGVNVEEMDNTIFDGASAACCTLQLDQAPSTALLTAIEAGNDVLQVTLEARDS
ncbi:MAG: 3-phosphoglycerate dehydrogenase family protein [Planctomycetota bacterium]|nr:3-phosphoglycerate dehydrogenase family protein [Planctomycetota bacterium]